MQPALENARHQEVPRRVETQRIDPSPNGIDGNELRRMRIGVAARLHHLGPAQPSAVLAQRLLRMGRTFAGDGLLQCDVGVVQGITATGAHYVDRVVQSRLPHACSLPPPRRRASV